MTLAQCDNSYCEPEAMQLQDSAMFVGSGEDQRKRKRRKPENLRFWIVFTQLGQCPYYEALERAAFWKSFFLTRLMQ